ncbi:MAG: phosphomethylpyrimidine synthase ThiC, partial [Candidatus Hydrothermarchaeota archaeon]|nr:phosphomethylpyrimidine synthase ThiC [Candidatus Hydrothermarchaeota archaeon]
MTQLTDAGAGKITGEMKWVSRNEGLPVEKLMRLMVAGKTVILGNRVRKGVKPLGVGQAIRVKINANIGTSPDRVDLAEELEKGRAAVEYGADAIMDLSIGGDLDEIRRRILSLPVPIGTVPIYQAVVEARKRGDVSAITPDHIFNTIEKQAMDGVDFMTIHAGITRECVDRMQKQGRLTDIVSRGGSFLAHWMLQNEAENPLYGN